MDPQQSERDKAIVVKSLADFSELSGMRTNFEEQWEETAALIWPSRKNTFTYGNFKTPGEKNTEHQVDATGQLALSRFCAIVDSLSTPRNMRWHGLQASDPALNRSRRVRLWFEEATDALFKHRYTPTAGFVGQNQRVYKQIGAFGTGPLFIDKDARRRGLRYKALPIGQVYLRLDHQGRVNGFIRVFRCKPVDAVDLFGDAAPNALKEAVSKTPHKIFEFIQDVRERMDYDPDRWDYRGMRFASYYISVDLKRLISEGGYNTLPLAAPRYEAEDEEIFGRGPATFVLPALKTLNAQKRTFLKQGHRAADPVLLMADDGLLDMDLRPGAQNKGGWSAQGYPLVGVLPTGEIQISKEMMAEERAIVNDMFLVTLFQILTDSPKMTATEVIERTNEKGILLAPTVGNLANDYTGPMIDREIDLLQQQGLLAPMPPELVEAEGAYEIVYTSPLARAARAQEAAGFMRTVEAATAVANVTQDPAIFDGFEFDVAIPEIAEIQSVPERWMASPESIARKREQRAQAQAAMAQVQAMPAEAAMLKAEKQPNQNQG
jgi:hypothetical protein